MPSTTKEAFFLSGTNANAFAGESAAFTNKTMDTFSDYRFLFDNTGCSKVIGEACVTYLFCHQQTIANIEKYLGTNY